MDQRIDGLVVVLLLLRELATTHRQCKIRCALVHSELLSDRSHLLNHLDTTGTGTNDRHLLASIVDAANGPEGGVMDFSLERVETRDIRDICTSSAHCLVSGHGAFGVHLFAENPAATIT